MAFLLEIVKAIKYAYRFLNIKTTYFPGIKPLKLFF